MSKHLHHDLEYLKERLLEISGRVATAVEKSVLAFRERRSEIAEEVIVEDNEIDRMEVSVEEHCLKSLALHQPVAEDLRFICAVMKINNDLERMGDCAVSIARRARSLAKGAAQGDAIDMPHETGTMTETTLRMVRDSLDAFIARDVKKARHVCETDDVVDDCHRKIIDYLRGRMRDNGDAIDQSLDIFSAVRRLERIADLATNIAEDVVYMVEGTIIRHAAKRD